MRSTAGSRNQHDSSNQAIHSFVFELYMNHIWRYNLVCLSRRSIRVLGKGTANKHLKIVGTICPSIYMGKGM